MKDCPGLVSSSIRVRYSRRQQTDHRYLQAKYELTFNDEDEIDFNVLGTPRFHVIGTPHFRPTFELHQVEGIDLGFPFH